MTTWDHLPNAAHIDRVIKSVQSHPDAWNEAGVTSWGMGSKSFVNQAYEAIQGAASNQFAASNQVAAWVAAWMEARDAAYGAGLYLAWHATQKACWGAVDDATWDEYRKATSQERSDAAWRAAWDATQMSTYFASGSAVSALVAYDHAAQYLEMSSDQLKELVSGKNPDPAAVLMLPAVIAFETINKGE